MIGNLLNNFVTVYSITQGVSTATGENVETLSTGITIKARISPLSQQEQYFAHKEQLNTTHRLYCEYVTTWDTWDQVYFNGVMYEITGTTNPSEANKFLQINLQAIE